MDFIDTKAWFRAQAFSPAARSGHSDRERMIRYDYDGRLVDILDVEV